MTTIDAQGNLHDHAGQFAEKAHSAPAAGLTAQAQPPRVKLTATSSALVVSRGAPLYPEGVPRVSNVSIVLDDATGKPYVTFSWEVDGETYDLSVTGEWDSDDSRYDPDEVEALPFGDDNDLAVSWALENLDTINSDWGALAQGTMTSVAADLLGAAGLAPNAEEKPAAERGAARGAKIVDAFGEGVGDDATDVSDSIADLLHYAASKDLDLDALIQRARRYVDDETES